MSKKLILSIFVFLTCFPALSFAKDSYMSQDELQRSPAMVLDLPPDSRISFPEGTAIGRGQFCSAPIQGDLSCKVCLSEPPRRLTPLSRDYRTVTSVITDPAEQIVITFAEPVNGAELIMRCSAYGGQAANEKLIKFRDQLNNMKIDLQALRIEEAGVASASSEKPSESTPARGVLSKKLPSKPTGRAPAAE